MSKSLVTVDDLESIREHVAQVFDGFICVGFPMTENRTNDSPCCIIRHDLDRPRAERMVTALRGQIELLEDFIFHRGEHRPPQPPTEGEEWKVPQ